MTWRARKAAANLNVALLAETSMAFWAQAPHFIKNSGGWVSNTREL